MIIKTALLFTLFVTFLTATQRDDIMNFYKNKNYKKTCLKGSDLFRKYRNDEEFLNIYAYSCLKEDMINGTVLPIAGLYRTKKSRENAAYFATILYQKKLLYHALVDDVDISYINLPKTGYILSVIFNKFVEKDYDYKSGVYWFNDDNESSIKYKLSVEPHRNIEKIFLRTYKNGKIVKERTYW